MQTKKQYTQYLEKLGLFKTSEPNYLESLSDYFYTNLKDKMLQDQDATNSPHIIRTGCTPINKDEYYSIKKEENIITCAFGGTNWIVSLVSKNATGRISTIHSVTVEIDIQKRTCVFEKFIEMMANLILKVYLQKGDLDLDTLAISFGFPHQVIKTSYGIDAHLFRSKQPKSWRIIDFDDYEKPPLIGKSLLEKLNKSIGRNIFSKIFILNDTNAVSNFIDNGIHDDNIEKLPVGFVFGTGSNASFQDMNLEAGKFIIPDEFIQSEITKNIMLGANLIHSEKNLLEYQTGGIYIVFQIFAILKYLASKGCIHPQLCDWFLNNPSKSLVSDIVKKQLGFIVLKEELKNKAIEFRQEDYEILFEVCKHVLLQASGMIAVLITCVLKLCEYQNHEVVVPVEGAVFWKGAFVKERILDLLERSFPGNKLIFQNASSIIGIAQFAIVRNNL